jgi:hypothetical protein
VFLDLAFFSLSPRCALTALKSSILWQPFRRRFDGVVNDILARENHLHGIPGTVLVDHPVME